MSKRFCLFVIGLISLLFTSWSYSEDSTETTPGLAMRIYQIEQELLELPKLASDQTPNIEEVKSNVNFQPKGVICKDFKYFYATLTGYIDIPENGQYLFEISCDDGARVLINDAIVTELDGVHKATEQVGSPVTLEKGRQKITVEYFDHGGDQVCVLKWQKPGSKVLELIPDKAYSTDIVPVRVTSPGYKRVASGTARPGDRKPVDSVHPGYTLFNLRPNRFEPKVSSMAFLPDGRLVIGTMEPNQNPDPPMPRSDQRISDRLFAISGVQGDDISKITIKPIADNLNEPLGLCVVGNDIYVATRPEVLKLIDKDGDGYYETHETIATGWECWNFHEFTFNLLHRDGKLYTALGTGMGGAWKGMEATNAPQGPMRGSIMEIDLASKSMHAIAGGTRTPNGLGFGPEGTMFYLDNQGTWMPTSIMGEVVPGRFFGHYNNQNPVAELAPYLTQGICASVYSDRKRALPTLWMPHNEVNNSPTIPLLVDTGIFKGQMLIGELTAGGIRRANLERINGLWQGALFQFTQGLEGGVNRMCWGPDGSLYIGSIGAGGNWNWRATKFGLQRLKPNGKAAFEMLAVHARPDGFEIEFTKPADSQFLSDPNHFTIRQWSYEPTYKYGGEKTANENLKVKKTVVSDGGRKVRLYIDGLKTEHCIYIHTDPKSVDGEEMWATECWYTLNNIPTEQPIQTATLSGKTIQPDAVGVGVLAPADAVTLLARNGEGRMKRVGKPEPTTQKSQDDLLNGKDYTEVGFGSGQLQSRTDFGDCRVHVEWYSPPGGTEQMAGNSGVFLQNLYEVQVLGTLKDKNPIQPNEAGAIYFIKAADKNASTGPGTWQAYDIYFHAPRFKDGKKLESAHLTVYWNGQLVQNDVEIKHATGDGHKWPDEPGGSSIQYGPLALQDHASKAEGPVRYRNIWIAPLESSQWIEGTWVNLFDGQSLNGWSLSGGNASFVVDQNEIVAKTTSNPQSTLLATTKQYNDYELLVDVKMDHDLNSSLQIRSNAGDIHTLPENRKGYQIDLDLGKNPININGGGINDGGKRGWLNELIDQPYARQAWKKNDWNQVRVVARSSVIQTWINGVPAGEIFDDINSYGQIGLQIQNIDNDSRPHEARFKNIRLRELQKVVTKS